MWRQQERFRWERGEGEMESKMTIVYALKDSLTTVVQSSY